MFSYWKYAAAVVFLGLISFALFKYAYSGYSSIKPLSVKPEFLHDALPGGEKATLTLADGNVISLDQIKNGTVRLEHGTKISRKNGRISYEATGDLKNNVLIYNLIRTPAGGQISIVLVDGSKVWLNSASSIHFPTTFRGHARVVEITGEAYFEIAKNEKMPFIVKAAKTSIEVLGTHFNVMAYTNEETTRTTLLEGSVKVTNGLSSKTILPGQQATSGDRIKVNAVDTDEAIAWKNGYFQFENEDLATIMRQLERWYDVKLDTSQKIPAKHFSAVISRNTRLSNVLSMLEMSGELKFEIEKNKIRIREY